MHSYLFEICNAKYLLNIYHMYLIFQRHYIFGNPYVYFRDIWGYKYINFAYGIFVCAYISSHWVAPFETKMTYLKNVFNIYENKDVNWGLGHRLAGTANNFHRVGKDPKIKVFFLHLRLKPGRKTSPSYSPPCTSLEAHDGHWPHPSSSVVRPCGKTPLSQKAKLDLH